MSRGVAAKVPFEFFYTIASVFRPAWRITGNTIKKAREAEISVHVSVPIFTFTSYNFSPAVWFHSLLLSLLHSRSSFYLSVSRTIHTFPSFLSLSLALALYLSFDCVSFAWLSDPGSLSHSLSPSKNFVSSASRKKRHWVGLEFLIFFFFNDLASNRNLISWQEFVRLRSSISKVKSDLCG